MFIKKLLKIARKSKPQEESAKEITKDSDDYDTYDNDHNDDNSDLNHNHNNIIKTYDSYDNYDNLHNLIKTQSKIINDVLNLLEKHDTEVKELINIIPSQTVDILSKVQKKYPRIYPSLLQRFENTVKPHAEKITDNTILAIIKRNGQISSLNLLEEITIKERLCTQSTFYLHLKKLIDQGFIEKKREGKTVYYSLPEIKVEKAEAQAEIRKHYDGYDSYDNYDRS